MSEIKLLPEEYLKYNKKEYNNLFGEWQNNLKELNEKFVNAKPFEYVIIDNFLNDEYANKIEELFPTDIEKSHKYCNPIEVKNTNDNINEMPEEIRKLIYVLSNDELINMFREISGIKNLEYDEYLLGAGLDTYPRNGRLNLHLDYEKHSITGKQRRINIILYLSKGWKEEWAGATELWNKDVSECVAKSNVKFNSALIFITNEISWHGVPEKINCPEGIFRKSLAYYYVSPLETLPCKDKFGADSNGYRAKASFIKRPQDPDCPKMRKLYALRPIKRIDKEDMEKIWPEWTPDL